MERRYPSLIIFLLCAILCPILVQAAPAAELPISEEPIPSDYLSDLLSGPCTACEDLSAFSQGEMTLITDERNQVLQVVFYNGSVYRTAIRNAPLIVYIHNDTEHFVRLTYTNGSGVANFDFSQWNSSCHDYRIFYCYSTTSCGLAKCFAAVGLNSSDLSVSSLGDIPLAAGVTVPSGPTEPNEILPTYASYRFCPPPPPLGSTMPVFCLPLIIIFSLLMGSLYMSGRNPFQLFDFSSPRMGKYIRYTARGRGFGFDLVQIAAGAVTAVGIAKNPAAMKAQNKAELAKGGAWGGLAAGVRKGIHSTQAGIKSANIGRGARFGRGGGKQMAGLVGSKLASSLTNQGPVAAVKGIVAGAKAGGVWGGIKAGLMQTSLAPIVGAGSKVAAAMAVASSVDAARQNLREWTQTIRFRGADGKMHEMVFRMEPVLDANKRETGAFRMVATDFVLNQRVTSAGPVFERSGSGTAVSMSNPGDWERFLTSRVSGSDVTRVLGQLGTVRDSGFETMQMYHRTVQFFVPLEISSRAERLGSSVTGNSTLQAHSGEATGPIRGAGAEGHDLVVTGSEIRAAGDAVTYAANRGDEAGMARPEAAGTTIRTINVRDESTGAIVTMSLDAFRASANERILDSSGRPLTTVKGEQMPRYTVECFNSRTNTTDYVSIGTYLHPPSEDAGKLAFSRPPTETNISLPQVLTGMSNQDATRLNLTQARAEANQLLGMEHMVMASAQMYQQLEQVRRAQADALAVQRDRVIHDLESNTDPNARVARETTIVIFDDGRVMGSSDAQHTAQAENIPAGSMHTTTVGEALHDGKTNEVFVFLARMDPDRAPPQLESYARGASGVISTESYAMVNFASVYEHNYDFTGLVARAPQLEGINLLRAERDGDIVMAQLAACTRPSIFDARTLDVAHVYEPQAGASPRDGMFEQSPNPSYFPLPPGKSNAGLPEFMREPQVREEDAIALQRQALHTAAELFMRPISTDEVGRQQTGSAVAFAFQDMGSHPAEAIATLSALTSLAESRDNPERFGRIYQGLSDLTLADRPEDRNQILARMQVNEASDRFGDQVRVRAVESSIETERGFHTLYDEARERRLREAGDESARVQIEQRFVQADNLHERMEAASRSDTDAFLAAKEAREQHRPQAEIDAAERAARQARAVYEETRGQYYAAAFNAIGDTGSIDKMIGNTIMPGGDATTLWRGYQLYDQHRSEFATPNDAVDFLGRIRVDDTRNPDPFRPMRNGDGDIPSLYTRSQLGGGGGGGEPQYHISLNTTSVYPPHPQPFSYDASIHEEVLGAGGGGMQTTEDLRARGLLR